LLDQKKKPVETKLGEKKSEGETKKVIKKEGEVEIKKKTIKKEGEVETKKVIKKKKESDSEEEVTPLNQKKEKNQKFGPKKEIIEVEKKKVDFGSKKKVEKICAFFNTERGCKQGNECPFAHIVGKSGEMPKKKVE